MNFKNFSRKKWITLVGLIIFGVLFYFREQIWESKIGKAKMEIFETILRDEPEEALENTKIILDTLFNQ